MKTKSTETQPYITIRLATKENHYNVEYKENGEIKSRVLSQAVVRTLLNTSQRESLPLTLEKMGYSRLKINKYDFQAVIVEGFKRPMKEEKI